MSTRRGLHPRVNIFVSKNSDSPRRKAAKTLRYSFLLTVMSALFLIAALWAYSTGYVTLALVGLVIAVGALVAVWVRAWHRASAVLDGADRMLDEHRQRHTESTSLDA